MMMGRCTATDMFFGLLGMLAPLMASSAIIYLIMAGSRNHEHYGAR